MNLTIVMLVVMLKKVYISSTQVPFKKDITIIEIVLHMKYIDTELVYLCVGN